MVFGNDDTYPTVFISENNRGGNIKAVRLTIQTHVKIGIRYDFNFYGSDVADLFTLFDTSSWLRIGIWRTVFVLRYPTHTQDGSLQKNIS